MVVQHRIYKDSLPMCVENTQFVARAQLQEHRSSPLHGLKSADVRTGLLTFESDFTVCKPRDQVHHSVRVQPTR